MCPHILLILHLPPLSICKWTYIHMNLLRPQKLIIFSVVLCAVCFALVQVIIVNRHHQRVSEWRSSGSCIFKCGQIPVSEPEFIILARGRMGKLDSMPWPSREAGKQTCNALYSCITFPPLTPPAPCPRPRRRLLCMIIQLCLFNMHIH